MSKTKTMLLMVIAGSVAFSVALWFYMQKAPMAMREIVVACLVGLIVLASVLIASKRIKNEKKGLSNDDELSLRIKERAAAISFTGSFLIWNFILLFLADKQLSNAAVIGVGIIAQGLLFFGSLFYYHRKGI